MRKCAGAFLFRQGGIEMARKKETKTAAKKVADVKKEPVTKATPKKVKEEKEKKLAIAAPKEATGFPLVGMGASAGGLEALETFFTHMPPDKNIAFMIIQHLSPKHKSIMGSLLSKCTTMEVLDLKDGMKIEPNHVYLNPPDKNVMIMNGKIHLMEPIRTGGINLSIDCFFKSMAEDLGEKAIGIILSGTATDGTLGLKAIKAGGGIAMVQDPDSAKYDGMPRSAIATGIVDFILPVEKLPAALAKYIRAPYIAVTKKVKATDDLFASYIQKIFVLIRSSTGHDISRYKQTTLRRRIERRMAVHQINKISDYVKYLQKIPSEVDILFKDMLIGVTGFFRDPDAFKILEEQVLPALLKDKPPNSTIRIWIVGCSTGEEAYSIAVLLSEAMERMKLHVNVQIFASDIDAEAIERARTGVYPDSIAADVSPERLRHFFIKDGTTFQVKKHLREMIIFAVQNIISDPPFSRIDLLSCRNLLIYMDSNLQKKILPLSHYALNSRGVLFLGPSESIGEFTDLFQPVNSKWKIFKRKEFFKEKAIDYPGMPFYQGPRLDRFEEKEPVATDIYNVAERIILDQYAPPGVLVNEKYEIVHFLGRTNKYLETPTGKASFNILNMAREGLQFKLSTALHNAVRQKKTISYEGLRIKYNGGFRIIDLTVRPLTEANIKENFMLVMFDDKTPGEKPILKKGKKAAKDDSDLVLIRLEQELQSTKEHLQTTIEELETSNEELKSTNEELQSLNEEMQSANEELETSKEELQSTNEELVTVNAELQNKVNELSTANNDINNLLAATDIGTIFLNTKLQIKRYTPAMTRIFNLIPSDLDRKISDITAKIDYGTLVADAEHVLDTLTQKRMEIRTRDDILFDMTISPYRTTENVIDGVVITFVDITKIKEGEKSARLVAVVRDSNDAILLHDFEGNITAWNRGAENMYGYTEAEALKMNIRDIVPEDKGKEALAMVKKLWKEEIESFNTQRLARDGRRLDVWLTVTKLCDDKGEPYAIATTERDITGKKLEA